VSKLISVPSPQLLNRRDLLLFILQDLVGSCTQGRGRRIVEDRCYEVDEPQLV
jgi:hypothetical protein